MLERTSVTHGLVAAIASHRVQDCFEDAVEGGPVIRMTPAGTLLTA